MIVLGLGSNMGDREDNLKRALQLLNQTYGIAIQKLSSIYETAPFGDTDQADFLNLTAAVSTDLAPERLLRACLAVEQSLGRIRTRRWGPRIIDIDMLLYNDIKINDPELFLPHPGIMDRAFVLIPLAEMAPDLVLPDGRTAAVAADCSTEASSVRLYRKFV